MNDIVTENQPAHERTHAAKQADINEPSLQSATDTAAVQAILQALLHSHQFEESQIKTDSESLEHWGKDWTKHFAPAASAIVFPKSTEQVQAIVLLANKHNVVLTPSGGRTGEYRLLGDLRGKPVALVFGSYT